MSDISFKLTAATHVGLVRTNNEDNFTVNPDLTNKEWAAPEDADSVLKLGKNGCLMVVADGMGGLNAGEVASELAVTGIRNAFEEIEDYSKITDTPSHIEAFMKKIIVNADATIKKRVKDDPSTEGMGTTIVMVWVLDNVAHVAWCGDSRAYLFNKKSGLCRLSHDHSYVQELVDAGKLDAELAFDHPNSNIITRSLGDFPGPAHPDYICKGLSTGDTILLCSDGLCGLIRDDEIVEIMNRDYEHFNDLRDSLFEGAFQAGGHDNVTMALMECVSIDEPELTRTLTSTVKHGHSSAKTIIIVLATIIILAALVFVAYKMGWVSFNITTTK